MSYRPTLDFKKATHASPKQGTNGSLQNSSKGREIAEQQQNQYDHPTSNTGPRERPKTLPT